MAWLVYEKGEEINEYVDVCRLVLTGWLDRLLSGWLDRMFSGWHYLVGVVDWKVVWLAYCFCILLMVLIAWLLLVFCPSIIIV